MIKSVLCVYLFHHSAITTGLVEDSEIVLVIFVSPLMTGALVMDVTLYMVSKRKDLHGKT